MHQDKEAQNKMPVENESTQIQLYRLYPSRTLTMIEVMLHFMLLAIIIAELSGWLLFVTLLLLGLLGWRYFSAGSSRHALSDASIEVRASETAPLIGWRDGAGETRYPAADVRVIMSRYFVLLQFGAGPGRSDKLLLADSFDDINGYTRFRRQMKEMYPC